MFSVDGNNCNTHSINIHSIYSCHLLDACIYDEDSVSRVLYAVQHGHQVASGTWSHPDLATLSWDQSQYEATRVPTTEPGSLFNLTQFFFAVHDEMQRIDGTLYILFSLLTCTYHYILDPFPLFQRPSGRLLVSIQHSCSHVCPWSILFEKIVLLIITYGSIWKL